MRQRNAWGGGGECKNVRSAHSTQMSRLFVFFAHITFVKQSRINKFVKIEKEKICEIFYHD
jgi:hypothetical protein